MNKRRFLRGLAGIVLGAPWVARAGGKPADRLLLLQESPLAGFQYHAGESLWGHLRAGDRLGLAREPTNAHDPRAVRVDWHGRSVGYVPRIENCAVAQLLDRGERLTARIAALAESPDPWAPVRVRFWLELPA